MCEINVVSIKYHYVRNIYRNAIFHCVYSALNSDWVKRCIAHIAYRRQLLRKIKSVLNENNEKPCALIVDEYSLKTRQNVSL